jgi:hypothetical protein
VAEALHAVPGVRVPRRGSAPARTAQPTRGRRVQIATTSPAVINVTSTQPGTSPVSSSTNSRSADRWELSMRRVCSDEISHAGVIHSSGNRREVSRYATTTGAAQPVSRHRGAA